ncbi:hypothetical protein SAMN04487950_1725 [Halogranum rubrum]|uniref:Uncharacterized protein n=1 Tax=Halogranum rubrum TaxID=553466 RepID=A0A1I4DZ92_9EURY|nr:hypothetical protein [Halogranum rubrum]SFK98050.1 hypothetical protein SAMN04487950_1725 [Halogranum rubrum]
MDRPHLVALLVVLVGIVAVPVSLTAFDPPTANSLSADQTYPAGAGPDSVDFEALDADEHNVSYAPREHWDAYVLNYTEPDEGARVEGVYYINSTTGEILADRWHDAKVYRHGKTYVFYQPASGLDEHRREMFEADNQFVYDDTTDAFYRYDPHVGKIHPTTIGRHPDILELYTWEAVGTENHYGVPVLVYRATGERSGDYVPQLVEGTFELGVDDGVIYGFDITVREEGEYHYTYDVAPTEFPDHEWVDTAERLAGNTTSDNTSSS